MKTAEIAELVDGELIGPEDLEVTGVAALDQAEEGELSFLANPKYAKLVNTTGASAVLVNQDHEGRPRDGQAWIRCANPSSAFSRVVAEYVPELPLPAPGIHPQAVVDPSAKLGEDVHIGANAVIERDVVIGDRSILGAGSYVGCETVIGAHSRLYPNVTIRERCRIGDRVLLHCGVVIGDDGFGYEPDLSGGPHEKLPQVGIVQIDDDVEIGANTTVDRARFGRTWIQRNVKIDNLVQVAHNVVIGEGSFLMAQVGIAGSASIGKLAAMYGKAGLPGHVHVGDGARLMGATVPYGDVPAGSLLYGHPAQPKNDYLRQRAALRRLPDLLKEFKQVKAKLAALEDAGENDQAK